MVTFSPLEKLIQIDFLKTCLGNAQKALLRRWHETTTSLFHWFVYCLHIRICHLDSSYKLIAHALNAHWNYKLGNRNFLISRWASMKVLKGRGQTDRQRDRQIWLSYESESNRSEAEFVISRSNNKISYSVSVNLFERNPW